MGGIWSSYVGTGEKDLIVMLGEERVSNWIAQRRNQFPFPGFFVPLLEDSGVYGTLADLPIPFSTLSLRFMKIKKVRESPARTETKPLSLRRPEEGRLRVDPTPLRWPLRGAIDSVLDWRCQTPNRMCSPRAPARRSQRGPYTLASSAEL